VSYLKYNTSYTKRHPDLYKFINIFKREESSASIKYFRAISGYEADKRKKNLKKNSFTLLLVETSNLAFIQ
jgi:hypothetical protein